MSKDLQYIDNTILTYPVLDALCQTFDWALLMVRALFGYFVSYLVMGLQPV